MCDWTARPLAKRVAKAQMCTTAVTDLAPCSRDLLFVTLFEDTHTSPPAHPTDSQTLCVSPRNIVIAVVSRCVHRSEQTNAIIGPVLHDVFR